MDIRLCLIVAGFLLAAVAGDVSAVLRAFLSTFADEKFVVPICSAMGFAYVLRFTGCDQHLVQLLVKPLRRCRSLLIPGTVAVGFLVNMPVVSQTSTAVTIGSVVIPVLQAARVPPVTIGSALLLGSSIGGELLNQGAPELRTTVTESQKAAESVKMDAAEFTGAQCVRRILPLNLLGLVVATAVFWWLSRRDRMPLEPDSEEGASRAEGEPFRVNYLRAFVPLIPLILLYAAAPPLELIQVDREWLVDPRRADAAGLFGSRLVGTAMLIGVLAAALATPACIPGSVRAFFEGAGYGFTHIISLIVAASCFGAGIKEIGVADLLGELLRLAPGLLLPLAGLLPLAFAVLCGSGMAATQSLFGFFAGPALAAGADPLQVGAVVSLAAAAGRTMSPVSAVCLMCAELTDTRPLQLARRVALPLLCSVISIVIAAMIFGP
ncbi:MAG: hypothetical protein FJ271_07450 [Planctomycetes bacterium]|nr:hypothetical protein [Planctomycetota bacterium]